MQKNSISKSLYSPVFDVLLLDICIFRVSYINISISKRATSLSVLFVTCSTLGKSS